jgi:Zinc binding domain
MDCGCTNCSCDDKEIITSLCPECASTGNLVPEKAVKANLKKEFSGIITNKNIYLCQDTDCRTSYYSKDYSLKYSVSDLKRPLWYKKGSEPVIACYCNNITEDQVISAVENHNLESWKDIVLHYQEKTLCACRKLNPTGQCCTDFFYSIINKTLSSLGREQVTIPGGCTC